MDMTFIRNCTSRGVTGAGLVDIERQHQLHALGFDAAHDDTFTDHELLKAALAYIVASDPAGTAETLWPWNVNSFSPRSEIQNLIRAGALICAEIDRLVRAGIPEGDQ